MVVKWAQEGVEKLCSMVIYMYIIYSKAVPFQEVKVPRFHDNSTG